MIDDFLYDHPDLYERVFPERGKSDFCIRVFQEHLLEAPASILDIGCGTGRDLAQLSKHYANCVGIDAAESMITYAREKNPDLELHVGDMRSHRLNRTFDVICALGGCINFALTNEELAATIKTYQDHAHDGTLLLIQPLNSCDFFGGFKLPDKFTMQYKGSNAVGRASYKTSKIRQVVERTRIWTLEGEEEFSDSMSFRIIFPAELTYFLERHGFEVLDIYEAPGSTAYATSSLYVIARFHG